MANVKLGILSTDYDGLEYETGHGNHIQAALGYETKELALEMLIFIETEQARTGDGSVIGLKFSGEYLVKENISIEGDISQSNESDTEYDGTDYEGWSIQDLLIGANFKTDVGTYSFYIENVRGSRSDDDYSDIYLAISALYEF